MEVERLQLGKQGPARYPVRSDLDSRGSRLWCVRRRMQADTDEHQKIGGLVRWPCAEETSIAAVWNFSAEASVSCVLLVRSGIARPRRSDTQERSAGFRTPSEKGAVGRRGVILISFNQWSRNPFPAWCMRGPSQIRQADWLGTAGMAGWGAGEQPCGPLADWLSAVFAPSLAR